MRKLFKVLLSAGYLALVASGALTAQVGPAEAKTSIFLGFGLPLYVGPPAYYYPPPPPPGYYAPPPGYYTPPPPPCRARWDWRWNGYAWQRVYVGCW
jgi:hypothetical protein